MTVRSNYTSNKACAAHISRMHVLVHIHACTCMQKHVSMLCACGEYQQL